MSQIFKQDHRMGRLLTALGKDVLVLRRFEGADHINALFEYQVDCLATSSDLNFDDLLGTHATVTLLDRAGAEQPFDGIVTEARWLGTGDNGHRYRLILKPWFYLASLRRNQRIFHRKTVDVILTELLASYSDAGPLDLTLSNDYPELEYTVQYRESDMAFACRMMERHGISYSFRHQNGAHTMVLSDMVDQHPQIGERPYKPVDGHHQEDVEHFWEWHPARRMTTGAVRLTDYNFKTPKAAMEVDQLSTAKYQSGLIEGYDWPGDYLGQGRGKVLVRLGADRERGQDRRFEAMGDIPSLYSGVRVALGGDKVPGRGEEYICLSAYHSYRSDNYGTGADESDGYAYSARNILMPVTAPLLPERKTARADVKGPQTATVVGKGEIDCDEYGRILVRFHWDLDAAHSMRCRVSQNWSGNGWGGMVVPRIGMEVLVEFLDGDPDKPLVTGCVFNGANDVPYPLPLHKTKSVFRTDTHQGQGFNELSFEDERGVENIALHAQKDQTLKVLNNRMKRVDNDQVESVGSNKSIEIGKNHQERIGGSMNLTIGGGKTGLFAALAGVMGQATSDAMGVAGEAGNPMIPAFLAGAVAQTVGGEVASSPRISAFDSAGNNRAIAGADQAATGTALGSTLSGIMPISGVKNTVIEKFQSDTIGLARTEQIGLFKNTMVGAVQNTMVGAKQFTKIGMEQRLKVGKTKTAEIGEEYTVHAGKRAAHSSGKLFQISSEEKFEGSSKVWEIKANDTVLLSAPGGYIEISPGGVKIRGKSVKIQGNSIAFSSGGPGEGSKCLRAMAASATPFVR